MLSSGQYLTEWTLHIGELNRYLVCVYFPVNDAEQVHISQSNKTGLSLPTWMDGCTFNPCVGVGEGGRRKHTQSPLSNDPQSLC